MVSGGDSCMPYVDASRALFYCWRMTATSKERTTFINIQHQFLLSTFHQRSSVS